MVTGAASGIGYAMAESFSEADYAVALVDLSEHHKREAAETIATQTGNETCWCVADVRDFEACRTALDRVASKLGVPSVLVNNAGIVRVGSLESTSLEH